MKTVMLTGATGVMGHAALEEILKRGDCKVRLLVRDSKKNHKKMQPYIGRDDVTIVWGDIRKREDVREALGDADIVLHIGGLVSPYADRYPQETMRVNVMGTENLVKEIQMHPDSANIKLVYIGSVAQMSNRMEPLHWGRTGDPIMPAKFDVYARSKVLAERAVAESGLKYWVSLRQSGILHPGLFLRGSNPITFHVPLRGVLEWATVEDSGRLMAAICGDDVPEEFWQNFYNIGSGQAYRLSNYEFEQLILGAIGSPKPEKIFETNWFATRNFHGCWYLDSDKLERMVPFRQNIPVKEYFKNMVKKAPWWARLAPLAPSPLVKMMMKKVASTKGEGTLDWVKSYKAEDKIEAFFGSREERDKIPGWKDFDLSRPSDTPVVLNHGYDESKSLEELNLTDMEKAAEFRGGRCLSESYDPENPVKKLLWECGKGHKFEATPNLILKGGHWCPVCEANGRDYREEARKSPFIEQVVSSDI